MRNDRILAAALRKREKGRMNLEIGGGKAMLSQAIRTTI
jgi:hypothetical protein